MSTRRIDPDLHRLCYDQVAAPEQVATFHRQLATTLAARENADLEDRRILESWGLDLGPERFNDWLSLTEGLPRTVSYLLNIGALVDVLAALPHVPAIAQERRGEFSARVADLLEPWDVLDGYALKEFCSQIHYGLRRSDLSGAWKHAEVGLEFLEALAPHVYPRDLGAELLAQLRAYREYFAEHLDASRAELTALTQP